MTSLVKGGSLLPTWTRNLLDTGRLFNSGLLDFDGDFPSIALSVSLPSVNVTEDDKQFKLELAAPGLEIKDFKVEVDNGVLCICSEKEEEKKEEKKNYTRREYSYKGFSRNFTLPENCLADKIDAKYENGILNITLPKKEVTVTKAAKEIKVS